VTGTWTLDPLDASAADDLAEGLSLHDVTAAVLVRRGYADPEAAGRFLAAEMPGHDPNLLGDMEVAVQRIRAAVAGGKRICVHGDYDVDGICATALAVLFLRELGADVVWHLPSRFEEGYGVSSDTLGRLVEEGVGLVLTVDCGITAVEEVAEAKALGLEVVVTDHHRPGPTLPDCPIVATRPSDYPFPELCGTGVVFKLGEALLGADSPAVRRQLDLVALATVADVVPLLDENRALATAGLRALSSTRRPGLQALMQSAHVDPATVDASAIGFRLAPRINAAGRLCRPDIALELILTEDKARAKELAAELEELNRERQAVEDRIVREAVALVEALPPKESRRRGYVLWSEDWHEGVIGIVASRLVERFNRPVVLVAGSGEGWKGSGRSIGSFDLHGALAACAAHLERFGGHRAAAGLSILPENLEAFAEAFAAHADAVLDEQDLVPVTSVDAVVSGRDLTLGLAQELERLAPFGLGNPDVTLLVPACQAVSPATVGEGKHLRFRVHQHGQDAGSAIAFGQGSQLDRLRAEGRFDVACRLKENHWNGTVAPQLVVRRLFDTPDAYESIRAWLAGLWQQGEDAWTADARRVFEELGLDPAQPSRRRQLLESDTFRVLLEAPLFEPEALPRAA
jgi:single-stranded-DNA-specific exonuclease